MTPVPVLQLEAVPGCSVVVLFVFLMSTLEGFARYVLANRCLGVF